MIDWAELTLFLYITARISGFVLFNPVLGRRNIPGIFRSGLILVLSVFVISFTAPAAVRIPGSVVEMGLRILLELALGYLLGLVMNFFFYIPQLAGHAIDTQMGMTMNQVYDASAQAMLELFVECTLLAVKLCMPILAAELLGQLGMGVLMKVIPQINVFSINIELKVIIGLGLLLLLMAPFSEFLLEAERAMLDSMHTLLLLL